MPDAMGAASATISGATLVTRDQELATRGFPACLFSILTPKLEQHNFVA